MHCQVDYSSSAGHEIMENQNKQTNPKQQTNPQKNKQTTTTTHKPGVLGCISLIRTPPMCKNRSKAVFWLSYMEAFGFIVRFELPEWERVWVCGKDSKRIPNLYSYYCLYVETKVGICVLSDVSFFQSLTRFSVSISVWIKVQFSFSQLLRTTCEQDCHQTTFSF